MILGICNLNWEAQFEFRTFKIRHMEICRISNFLVRHIYIYIYIYKTCNKCCVRQSSYIHPVGIAQVQYIANQGNVTCYKVLIPFVCFAYLGYARGLAVWTSDKWDVKSYRFVV